MGGAWGAKVRALWAGLKSGRGLWRWGRALKGESAAPGAALWGRGSRFPWGRKSLPAQGGQRSEVTTPPFPLGSVILELSKEKAAERLLERQAAAFGAAVAKVEAELGAQIRYLTQVGVGGQRSEVKGRGLGGSPK